MARWIVALLAVAAWAQTPQQQKPEPAQKELKRERPEPAPPKQYEAPPEEDVEVAVPEYSFNPLQSEKDVTVGNLYWKQGSYRAALMRFRSATKWNENNSKAWLRLGEAAEKLKDGPAAKEAYSKYLKLEPEAKNAPDIKKRLAKLK